MPNRRLILARNLSRSLNLPTVDRRSSAIRRRATFATPFMAY